MARAPPIGCRLAAIASWTRFDSAALSLLVCTCQLAWLPTPTVWMIAPAPPPAFSTVALTCAWVAAGALNSKSEPPLKSMLSFSPRPNSAARLITRIRPEIVYHSRRRPTKSKETSPRYRRPPMFPIRDITPPSGWSGTAGPPPWRWPRW